MAQGESKDTPCPALYNGSSFIGSSGSSAHRLLRFTAAMPKSTSLWFGHRSSISTTRTDHGRERRCVRHRRRNRRSDDGVSPRCRRTFGGVDRRWYARLRTDGRHDRASVQCHRRSLHGDDPAAWPGRGTPCVRQSSRGDRSDREHLPARADRRGLLCASAATCFSRPSMTPASWTTSSMRRVTPVSTSRSSRLPT